MSPPRSKSSQDSSKQFRMRARSGELAMREKRLGRYALLGLYITSLSLSAQQSANVELGRLGTGAEVSFVRSAAGEWGLEIKGGPTPRLLQPKPARVEVYHSDRDIRQLA